MNDFLLYRHQISYLPSGNIESKSDAGNYNYATLPHAVSSIDNPNANIPAVQQDITYTAFQKANLITEGNYTLQFTYGHDYQRKISELKNSGNTERKIIYLGNYEEIITASGTYKVHYISSSDGLVAVNVKHDNNPDQLFFVHTDHLGSIIALYDANGNKVYEQNFDAWGRDRNPNDWTYTANPNTKPEWLIRGFTGHEHHPEFALINMNGRVYDPLVGRMLSPDNFVQSADFTQTFNRYSYALNNPLAYTDPSGDFLGLAVTGMVFVGNVIGNLMWGTSDVVGSAYREAVRTTSDFSNDLQVPIYEKGNTKITAGIDPFAMGISANIYNTEGDFTSSASVGIGLSGPFANAGTSYSTGDFTFGIGGGVGSNNYSYGGSLTYMGYGLGYSRSHYGASTIDGNFIGSQTTGAWSGYWPGGSFQIENDFLDFKKGNEDRWRTSAWELSIGNFSLGSYIYTNDPEGEGQEEPELPGTWPSGKVYSSPLWFGYRIGNTVSRIGYSHKSVQHVTQNLLVHRYGFFGLGFGKAPYFSDYNQFQYGYYEYSGYYNPYTLYGR